MSCVGLTVGRRARSGWRSGRGDWTASRKVLRLPHQDRADAAPVASDGPPYQPPPAKRSYGLAPAAGGGWGRWSGRAAPSNLHGAHRGLSGLLMALVARCADGGDCASAPRQRRIVASEATPSAALRARCSPLEHWATVMHTSPAIMAPAGALVTLDGVWLISTAAQPADTPATRRHRHEQDTRRSAPIRCPARWQAAQSSPTRWPRVLLTRPAACCAVPVAARQAGFRGSVTVATAAHSRVIRRGAPLRPVRSAGTPRPAMPFFFLLPGASPFSRRSSRSRATTPLGRVSSLAFA